MPGKGTAKIPVKAVRQLVELGKQEGRKMKCNALFLISCLPDSQIFRSLGGFESSRDMANIIRPCHRHQDRPDKLHQV
jgi:hypothetical protein